MAEEIDRLELNISVRDDDSTKKINDLADAISRLKSEVGGITAKTSSQIKSSFKSIQNGLSKPLSKITVNENINKELEKGVKIKQAELPISEKLYDFNKKETKEQEEQTKKQQKGLTASIKRIAVYRAIRALLKEITSAIKESFDTISQISPEFRDTLSSTTSSIKIIQGSVGSLVASVLPLVQPLLQGIATTIGTISNSISKTIAVMKGQGTYIKVNTDYWKEYQSAVKGTLLAFDTFTTLSTNDGMQGLFTEEIISESETSRIKEILPVIQGITATIGLLLSSAAITWIIDGGLTKVLGVLQKIDLIKFVKVTALVAGITLLVQGFKQLRESWENMNISPLEKVVQVINAILAGVIGTVIAVKALKVPIAVALAAGAALAGGVAMLQAQINSTKAFANGGMFNGAGTMYAIAGESGAEVVAQGSAGTGVLNVAQFKQAMVEALYEYGASRGDFGNMTVNLDGNRVGQAVANSTGFKNEARRLGNQWR